MFRIMSLKAPSVKTASSHARSARVAVPLCAVLLLAACSSSSSSSNGTTGTENSEPELTAPPTSLDLDYVPESMVTMFAENEIFSTFAELVSLTDLAPLFEADGEITVFILPNAAFDRLPPGTVDKLKDPANRDVLTRILAYHMLDGKVPEAQVTAGTLVMKSGDEMTVEVGPQVGYLMNIKMNGTYVLVGDLFAGKSVAHILADMVLPPGVDLAAL